METWKCDVCAKTFTGLICFQQHEASEKHKKKMRLMNGLTSETPKPVNPDSGNQLHCSICMVSISGLDNYQKHVNSLDHAIMIQKKNADLLSQSVSSTFELKTEQNQLMESTVSLASPVTALKSFAECKPCQKQFSGPEPYKQHLASAGHIKKCGLSSQTMQNDEIDSNVGNEKVNNLCNDPQSSVSAGNLDKMVPQPFARCDICQMQFSGAQSYQMHLVSDNHKKKAGNQLPGSLLAENQSALKCDICVMAFTGPVPYHQHLVSNGHKKKMNAAGFCTQLPPTESLSTLDTTQKTDYIGFQQCHMNDPRWYCEICKKQCSGPIPYNSHMISRDHSKNLRIREIEENLRKMKELSTSHLSNEVTSTVDMNAEVKKEMQESLIEYQINNLNIDVKSNDSKVLCDKFQMNANDSIVLPNFNIIPTEKLDVTVFEPEDEIVFNSPKKYRQKFQPEMDETKNVCYTEKVIQNNCLMVE